MADRLRALPRCLTGVLFATALIGGCPGNLDDVRSSLFSSAEAAERPETTADPLAALLGEIVPDDGPARPPYQLARYDTGLKPEQDGQASMARLRSQAVARQKRLEELWHQARRQPTRSPTPVQTAERKLLAYAFGQAPLDEIMTAARRAGTASRYRLARLLLAECRFNEAVRELAALADGDARDDDAAAIADRALVLLVRHQEDREKLAFSVPVLPLSFDLDGYLQRRAEDPATGRLIEGLRRTLTLGLRPLLEMPFPEDEELFIVEESPYDFDVQQYIAHLGHFRPGKLDEMLQDVRRRHLVTTGNELVLYRPGQEWINGERAELKLFSAFNGPLRFRLYRFDDEAQSEEITAEELARMKPQRTWTQTHLSLSKNNVQEPQERDVVVEGLREGYYLLSVEARYAPMIAACPFRLSNVALYVRSGCNQGVVVAVDRRDGRPVPDLPLELSIYLPLELSICGYPRVDAIIDRVRPAEERAFRDGFLNGQRDPDASDRSDTEAFMRTFEEILRRSRAYAQGSEIRQQHPDFHQTRQLRTGADGSAGFSSGPTDNSTRPA